MAVIMSNPDQSKHLETARMKIRGVWIDLVNLRSETYTQHSRIPTMEVGRELWPSMGRRVKYRMRYMPPMRRTWW